MYQATCTGDELCIVQSYFVFMLNIWGVGQISVPGVMGTGRMVVLTGSWVQGRNRVLAILPSSCISSQVVRDP